MSSWSSRQRDDHRGAPYKNTYCYVCRLAGGKVRELTEYWDTVLAAAVLDAPAKLSEAHAR